jgi:hypothetical protein
VKPEDVREMLLNPLACNGCFEKNHIDSSAAGKKALENAPFCPGCAEAVYLYVLEVTEDSQD